MSATLVDGLRDAAIIDGLLDASIVERVNREVEEAVAPRCQHHRHSAPRRAPQLLLGWLRTEENNYLSVPRGAANSARCRCRTPSSCSRAASCDRARHTMRDADAHSRAGGVHCRTPFVESVHAR